MSSGVVTGVIRSTIELGNRTDDSTQAARSGSFSRAKATIIFLATSPFPGMLSQDITVNGGVPSSRRSRSASTMNPNGVVGAAPSAQVRLDQRVLRRRTRRSTGWTR